jgi:dienelactone hydrolase
MRFSLLFIASAMAAVAAPPEPEPAANRLLRDYFAREVTAIESQPLPAPKTVEEWDKTRASMRKQLAEMLGLDSFPERTPLNATKTGEFAVDGCVIENLHYQSEPGLYVTANLYRPPKVEGRLPAILYVCGHSDVKGADGTSLGNKTHYQHHGAWFARHGYVCLVIDTVQLGEIRGAHHGTYNLERWWWISRGYTPAGVEAWNGIRGIDYLTSRPEVDPERIGVTGRSGGGAYSWWIAALDERVKVAAPTAGITTLRNHVVDGTVEGHCDCMFMVNTYRWDYDRVAALIAPRPLLILNTDKDTIFPLDGVYSVYKNVRGLYRALGAEGKMGLQIAEGPHQDTQALNTGALPGLNGF